MMQIGFDEEWVTPDNTPDSSLPPVGSSATVPGYWTWYLFYFGKLLFRFISYSCNSFEADFDGVATFNPARHYYLSAGYDYDLNEDFS